jgi:hypothetical protein
MSGTALITRLVRPRLLEALADTPVVLGHGPRQCGKTTLAKRWQRRVRRRIKSRMR